jgi:hypothetical protein
MHWLHVARIDTLTANYRHEHPGRPAQRSPTSPPSTTKPRADGLSAVPAEKAAEPLKLCRHAVKVGLAQHRKASGRKQSKTRSR